MAVCPECDANIEVDEYDVDKGDILPCPECGSSLEVISLSPVELDVAPEEDELDEEEDDDEEDEEEDQGAREDMKVASSLDAVGWGVKYVRLIGGTRVATEAQLGTPDQVTGDGWHLAHYAASRLGQYVCVFYDPAGIVQRVQVNAPQGTVVPLASALYEDDFDLATIDSDRRDSRWLVARSLSVPQVCLAFMLTKTQMSGLCVVLVLPRRDWRRSFAADLARRLQRWAGGDRPSL